VKKALAATLLSWLFFTSPMHLALASECSCSSSSCLARPSCPGSCFAVCSSEGCFSGCLEEGTGRAVLHERLTLQLANANSQQLSSELTRVSGREIAFKAFASDDTLNLDFKAVPLWNVLEVLSRMGTVQIDGQDFQQLQGLRRALLRGEKINVCFCDAPAGHLLHWLSFISGLPLHVSSGNAQARVTITLKEVTLGDIIHAVSTHTGVQVRKTGD